MRIGLFLAAALSLAACQSSPGRHELFMSAADIAQKDDAACRSFGALPGSDAYVNCRVQQQAMRTSTRNAAMAGSIVCNKVGETTICN